VSKTKLISVLYWLGLLTEENEGNRIVAIIAQIWKEAREYEAKLLNASFSVKEESAQQLHQDGNGDNNNENAAGSRYGTVDVEESAATADDVDTVELGSLKWIVYGIPSQRPSCFPSFCMPCAKPTATERVIAAVQEDHPIHKSRMKRESGELVRHDVLECLICKGAAGNPEGDVDGGDNDNDDDNGGLADVGSGSFLTSAEDEGEGGIEIDRNALGSILRDV
jgi:hypothetical protein